MCLGEGADMEKGKYGEILTCIPIFFSTKAAALASPVLVVGGQRVSALPTDMAVTGGSQAFWGFAIVAHCTLC